MNKVLQNQKIAHFWRVSRPWIIIIGVIAILRFSGGLAYISEFTGRALMATGAMNAAPKPPAVEKKFNYDFTLLDASGKKISGNDFKNKTLFLNIWATWCGPCRYEMPSIHKLYQEVNHEKIAFVMLSVDRADADAKVQHYIKENNFSFPVYRPDGLLPLQLDVTSIPTTFIVSPDGKIVSKKVGAASYDNDEFKSFLEGL